MLSYLIPLFIAGAATMLSSCAIFGASANTTSLPAPAYTGPYRTFTSSFESSSDFSGSYIVPAADYASDQALSTQNVHDGTHAFKGWITAARAATNDGTPYLPHRAYPTVQFQNTPDGIYRTPCLISLWVYLDITLNKKQAGSIDDWFSFAPFTPDPSNLWSRTVVVNITPDGYVRLVHVPTQTEQQYSYQAGPNNDPGGALLFPYRTWVRLDILIDFSSTAGYAKVWQNGSLVSYADVQGGNGGLAQAHFGLYAAADLSSGTVYNDKLRIVEVKDEAAAMQLVNSPW